VLITDPNSKVQYVNSRVGNITSVNREDYMGGDLLAWHRDASPPRQFRPKIHSLSALW
jgi:PAS domain-containing protein